jgi:hypothetical protein
LLDIQACIDRYFGLSDRPPQFGHNPPVEVVIQFERQRRSLTRLNVRNSAGNLMHALPRPGHSTGVVAANAFRVPFCCMKVDLIIFASSFVCVNMSFAQQTRGTEISSAALKDYNLFREETFDA